MTRKEFNEEVKIINKKLWNDSQKVIAEMKKEGTWIGGLGADPMELKELQQNALDKIKQLEKEVAD